LKKFLAIREFLGTDFEDFSDRFLKS